jgi:hypothetical protein
MSSMSKVPVAVEVQLRDIMDRIEPTGMVIVKVPLFPFMMTLIVVAFPPESGRCIVPEKAGPFLGYLPGRASGCGAGHAGSHHRAARVGGGAGPGAGHARR